MNSVLHTKSDVANANFEVVSKSKGSLSRTGVLKLKRRGKTVRIKTPVLWLTCTVNGSPQIWKELKEVKHVMLSCYDIIKNKKTYAKELLTNNNYIDIHKQIEFDGHIFMDSGGFQFLTRKKLDITPELIFKIQNRSNADLASILDYPFPPNICEEEKLESIYRTIKSLKDYIRFSRREDDTIFFLPVIHGHDSTSLIKMAKKVKKISKGDALSIGSLVPVLFPIKYTAIKRVARAFIEVRRMFPNSFIHVFGAGSALSSHLFFYLGADSVDSATWIIKAGFGNIHLPGRGAAYIKRDGRRKKCRFIDWDKYECECPICRKKAPDEILEEMDKHDSHARKLRAIHNAWVYLKEVELVKESIIEGEYENIVRQRMYNTSMRKILESLIQTVKSHKLV